MSDRIDQAINGTQPPETVTVQLQFDRGRAGVLVLPADTTAGEFLRVVAYLTGTVAPDVIARAQTAASPIVVPRPTLVLPS